MLSRSLIWMLNGQRPWSIGRGPTTCHRSMKRLVEATSTSLISVCRRNFTSQPFSPPSMPASTSFCEKPLVGSLADLDEIEAAANVNQLAMPVLPVFQYRFGEGIGQLLHLIDRGPRRPAVGGDA